MRKKLKILILAAAATIATSLALPAAADAYHYRYGYHYGHGFRGRGGFGHGFRGRGGYGHGFHRRGRFGHGFRGRGGFGYGHYGYGGGFAVDGSLRIEVNPKDSREDIEVYVDGGLAGVVNDFDGAIQRLRLSSGKHEIELKLEGYETRQMTIFIERGDTFHIRGEMVPLKSM